MSFTKNKNNNITNKFDFIEYSANRYGIDFSTAETFVDMFSDCLAELLNAGKAVDIDGIGKFETIPLFQTKLHHQNKIPLTKLTKMKLVNFKPSKSLLT